MPQSLDASDENKSVLVGMAVLMTVVAVLFVLFTLAMISRIAIATSVLQVATQVRRRPQKWKRAVGF